VKNINPFSLHEQVKEMYNWEDVARRTEKVYDRISSQPTLPLIDRLKKILWMRCLGWKIVLFFVRIELFDFIFIGMDNTQIFH